MDDHNEKVKMLKPLVFARVSNMSGTVRGIYTRDMINSEMSETNVAMLNALAAKLDIEETKLAIKLATSDIIKYGTIFGSLLAIIIIAAIAVQLI